jgi:branched-chain amino acid transport system permease protein
MSRTWTASRADRPAKAALPLVAIIVVLAVLPLFIPSFSLFLLTRILILGLFATAFNIVFGLGGMPSLGHAAFFGTGAYVAGILAVHGWSEPLSALLAAAAAAGLLGVVTGTIVLRTSGLTLLMVTLVVTQLLQEGANKLGWLTGGADGLQGIVIAPLLGAFRFDLFGRTAYLYSLAILFLAWVVARLIVHSPFGRSLIGIRENATRMQAIGSPVFRRRLRIYAISAALAGIAGALLTQTTQFVALQVLSFELSGTVLVMLILGGVGRLYGAFIGAPLYMIAQDQLARDDPVYWLFWIGLLLVLVVMFARGGILGIVDRLRAGTGR